MRRTRAQRRWARRGITHEVGYWSGCGKPWNFILVCGPEFARYMRRHGTEDDFVRRVCQPLINNGKTPR